MKHAANNNSYQLWESSHVFRHDENYVQQELTKILKQYKKFDSLTISFDGGWEGRCKWYGNRPGRPSKVHLVW